MHVLRSCFPNWIKEIKDELGEFKDKNPEKKVAVVVNQICHLSTTDCSLMAMLRQHEIANYKYIFKTAADLVKAIHSYGGLVPRCN